MLGRKGSTWGGIILTPLFFGLIWLFDHQIEESDTALGLFILACIWLVVAGLFLYGSYPQWQIYSGAKKRRPSDITSEAHPIPENAKDAYDSLIALGFHRIGETYTPIPNQTGISNVAWVFANDNGTIHVELIALNNGGVQFNTVFADEASLETGYPFGINIKRRNFRSIKNIEGVHQAYDQHRQVLTEMSEQHGPAISISTIPQLLEWDLVYREKYIHIKLFQLLRKRFWLNVTMLYTALWWFIAWIWVSITGEISIPMAIGMGILLLPIEIAIFVEDI